MCFADDAQPPAPPVRGEVGEQGSLVLESADGTAFRAYRAHPPEPADQAILILPDGRGLHPFYYRLAARWAETGRHALAVDYFGRTAGTAERGEDFPFLEHARQLDPADVARDASAGIAWLREQTGARTVFVVGFCVGGAFSWRQAAAGDGLAGAIGFYGIPSSAADIADEITAPLLVLAAGQDFTPVAETEAFAASVRARAGVDVQVNVYPDAPHSFFDQKFDDHREACADAWDQQLAFIDRNAG